MDNIGDKINQYADNMFGDKVEKHEADKNQQSIVNQACELVMADLSNYGIDDLEIIDASLKTVEEDVNYTAEEYDKILAEYKKDKKDEKDASTEKEAVSPPGWEKTVEDMKEHHKDKIDNPWALSWYMKNKGYKAHPNKKRKSTVEITLESPRFNDVIVATVIDVDDENLIQKLSYDDDAVRKAYDVGTFMVEIPNKGRYIVEAVNEEVALDNVIGMTFPAGELQDLTYSKRLPEIKANFLADGKVQRVNATMMLPVRATERVMTNPMAVVYEMPKGINLKVSDTEEPPTYVQNIVGEHEDDFDEYQKEKTQASIINQAQILIQDELNDLRLPVNVVSVKINKNEDGVLEGMYRIESREFNGGLRFTANIDEMGVVKEGSLQAETEFLKGIFGLKEYEVKIGERNFQTDAKNELEAVIKVMAYLQDKGEELTYEGRKFSNLEFDEVAEKIANTNTKVLRVYEAPNNTVLGEFKIVEEDGKKYFTKAEPLSRNLAGNIFGNGRYYKVKEREMKKQIKDKEEGVCMKKIKLDVPDCVKKDIVEMIRKNVNEERIVMVITERYPAIGEFSVRSIIRKMSGNE